MCRFSCVQDRRLRIQAAPTRKEQAAIDQQAQADQQQKQFEQQLDTRLMRSGAADITKQEADAVAQYP